MEWAELFEFPVDSLSLILLLYSSFPAVYCWVQNDVSFQGTECLNNQSLVPCFPKCFYAMEKWKVLK